MTDSATDDGSGGGLQPSIWTDNMVGIGIQFCPHCGEEIADPVDLRHNDEIRAPSARHGAYRRHRRAHYSWGDDPTQDGDDEGDPYLADYYSGATGDADDQDDDGEDEDEIVGHVYDVTVHYTAKMKARVVAPSEGAARNKATELKATNGEDLCGDVPEPYVTERVHTDEREIKEVTRGDEDLAERMEGWPW